MHLKTGQPAAVGAQTRHNNLHSLARAKYTALRTWCNPKLEVHTEHPTKEQDLKHLLIPPRQQFSSGPLVHMQFVILQESYRLLHPPSGFPLAVITVKVINVYPSQRGEIAKAELIHTGH